MVQDQLGSVRGLVKRDGTWIMHQRFTPYGALLARDSAGSSMPKGLHVGWTGREYDAETGFTFHRARYYSADLRRWTQEDPIGYAGGGNLYAYVGGAVMEGRDPSGLMEDLSGRGLGFAEAERPWKGEDPFGSGLDLLDSPDGGGALLESLSLFQRGIMRPEAPGPQCDSGDWRMSDDGGSGCPRWPPGNCTQSQGGRIASERYFCERLESTLPLIVGATARGGQLHHAIGAKIAAAIRSLGAGASLLKVLEFRNQLITRARDVAAHHGYQTWHRIYDNDIVDWIRRNPSATANDVMRFLNRYYSRPDMRDRFPGGLP